MAEIKEEFINFLSKVWFWAAYIFIGIIAKFSYNVIIGKKISLLQAIGSAGIAFFAGFIACSLCYLHDAERDAMWIVPCATLISDKLVIAAMGADWKQLKAIFTQSITDFFRYWINKNK